MSEQQAEVMRALNYMQDKLAEKDKREMDDQSQQSPAERKTPDITDMLLLQTQVLDKMNQTVQAAKEPKVFYGFLTGFS